MTSSYDAQYWHDATNRDALRREDEAALDAFNACHRLTPDERDDLAAWTARTRPELIRYGARLHTAHHRDQYDWIKGNPSRIRAVYPEQEYPTWPIESMTFTPRQLRATISTRVPASPSGLKQSSSGSSSASARGSASASSRGASSSSPAKSGARLLVDGAAWLLMFVLLAAWYLAVRQIGGA